MLLAVVYALFRLLEGSCLAYVLVNLRDVYYNKRYHKMGE